ncbi:type VI secretion system Vgr family protein [Desulfonema magnum]|uniref:Type VI secretion protein domain-containing protein, RhsGE-like n=1 Tax=Desulfonema magnum TaxID=45655 RepID=A0A975GLN7_9BACT|nr:type VI secretion system tip protein TssI/VgrG [Desulfonema magnum]QTA85814.1 Type VI secretion protein domain-containing protein, RhsGE-like [Desulfonema magnum]
MTESANEKVYLCVTTPLDGEARKFMLAEIEGEEHLSGLFHYRLKLRTDDNAVDFTQIVGQKITVTIEQYNGTKRYINGVVCRFIQAGYDGNITTYYAEIRPWFWQLTLTANSKIFQNMTVPDIIADVFSAFGLTDFDDRTTGTYNPRVYCVQYQETAYAFVSRLMEEEGIFYFFEHTEDKHMLILADDADAHQPCPGLDAARMRPVAHEDRSDDTLIDRCSLEQQMIPNKYASEDFNFETPDTDLLSSVDGKESGGFRIYDYPGKFGTTGDGEAIINKRIEAYELPQKLLRGQGFCRAFIAGYKFDLTEHDRDDMNVTYILRDVFIRADQDGYANVFEAFPGDVPFRPPLITKKPKVVGTQTAIVTGPAGEEIWPDEYGRVKVQFHWDEEGQRDENTSCWVRVAQMWAGKNWGTIFIPRIGMEVIVSFLEGDPDQPIITGTVYNASQVVPYALPGEKTKSTMKTDSSLGGGGFNEIRFEDKKGSEEIFLHGQKDWTIVIENDKNRTVGHDETLSVGNNRTKSVGVNQSESVGKNKSIDVGKNHTESIGDNASISIGKNETISIGKNLSESIGKNANLSVGKSLSESIGDNADSSIGKDLSASIGSNASVKVGKNTSLDVGKKLNVHAADEINIFSDKKIVLNAGKASITLKKNGDIQIKGKKFNFKASGDIKIKGSKIAGN